MIGLISNVLSRKKDQEALEKMSSGSHRFEKHNDYVIQIVLVPVSFRANDILVTFSM